jgi:protein-L-isoaspartate(D-aspartate) O-methyltransferase
MPDYATARLNMVESQIKTNRVNDPRVLDAFLTVPREQYVPKSARGIAYVDEDMPIGNDRHLMEPMILARLVQSAEITPDDLVLVIAANTGYASAIIAQLATTVVTVEEDKAVADAASRVLSDQGIDNAVVVEGPMQEGYPRQGPYDVVLFNGAVSAVPDAIFDQVAEGGRLLAIVSPTGHLGQAILYRKVDGVISHRILFDASAPWLPGFEAKPSFVF